MTYTVQIYAFSGGLPDAERYNRTAQLRKARFLSYAYRSLKEVITGLELCQRLYPSLPAPPVTTLIDEGNQLSRMTHSLMQWLGTGAEGPSDS